MQGSHHIFGPVPSRRLGRSLGVDLVPFKTCTYDCIYCQLGRTTCKTVERKEWVSIDAVFNELKQQLSTQPDYITLSGSGEPTLHSRIGEMIDAIQAMTNIPVAVLTNGSLLWQPEVRVQLANADIVLPSLDAGDALDFNAVNRPHAQISFDRMVEGLVEFRREFRGQYWLEVLLLDGVTGTRAEVEKIGGIVARIRPDKVHLNTVARPPSEAFACPVKRERLEEFAQLLGLDAKVIAELPSTEGTASHGVCGTREILGLLARRPCTADGVARGLGLHLNVVLKHLQALILSGDAVVVMKDGQRFYAPRRGAP